jgi:predicted solute-binding protein
MTVYRLLHSGEMPAVRVGRSFRVPQDALDHYLATARYDLGAEDEQGPSAGRLSS